MKKLSFQDLETIIENADFDKLIDSFEGEHLDCKSGIYKLTNDKEKLEFVKDVSSFANSDGGYILLGPQTEKVPTHPVDVIKSISYLPSDIVDTESYKAIAKHWIYPEIVNLEIYFKHDKENSTKGLCVIKIPRQDHSKKPFLITKSLLDADKTSEVLFGYIERRQDSSQPTDVRAIQNIMRNGINFSTAIERGLNRIEDKLDQATNLSDNKKISYEELVYERIKDVINAK